MQRVFADVLELNWYVFRAPVFIEYGIEFYAENSCLFSARVHEWFTTEMYGQN